MENLLGLLERQRIAYERHDHPAVYTVAEARRLVPELPGAKTKNLFLRDGKARRHLLVIVPADKRVDLKGLSQAVGADRLSFASADRLKRHLGVEPGAVTLLAVVNDPEHRVEVVIDRQVWQADRFQFHPLVNTATLLIAKEGIERLLAATGHRPRIIDVPERP